jgi:hypothetical protein
MADAGMTDLLAKAESLCRAIATRDLAGSPLYIVPQSVLPADFGGSSVCDGFTSPSLDLHIKRCIGPAWSGRGPCIVVNDVALRAETEARDFDQAFLAVVLHELAHVLERPMLYRERQNATEDVLAKEAQQIMHAVASEPRPIEQVVPFIGHGIRFIRAVLHLRRRAERLGAYLSPASLCGGEGYGLSHAVRYDDALGDEPDRQKDQTLADVLRTPPPPPFTDLWRTDVTDWFDALDPSTERILDEFAEPAGKDHEEAPGTSDQPRV